MKFDLHVHTKYSFDGIGNPRCIVKEAIKKNLNGLAITDHNTLKGYFFAKQLVEEGFFIIPGEEIRTSLCEVIGLFLTEEIKGFEFMEVVDKIREQGGIVALPHPFLSLSEEKLKAILGKVDAVEIFNSRLERRYNEKCREFLKKMKKIPIVAGSDAHTPKEVGNAYLITGEVSDYEELRRTILRGKNGFSGKYTKKFVKIYSNLLTLYKNKEGRKRIVRNFYKIFKPSYWRDSFSSCIVL